MIMVWANCGHNTKYMDAAVGSSMYGVLMIETTIIRELIPISTRRTARSPQRRDARFKAGRAVEWEFSALPLSIPKCSAYPLGDDRLAEGLRV
jgi:hypothetical protein